MQTKTLQMTSPHQEFNSSSSSSSHNDSANAWMLPLGIMTMGGGCSSWPGHVWRPDSSCPTLLSLVDIASRRSTSDRISCSSDDSDVGYDVIIADAKTEDNNNNNIVGVEDAVVSKETKTCQEDNNNNTIITDPNNNNSNVIISDTDNNNNNSNNNKNSKPKTKTKNSDGRQRLLDEEGFIRRAACVCVDETESKVLLVSSKKDPCSWLVPGGGLEAGEESASAAIREAWEEAGVEGHITRYLGLFETTQKEGRKKHRTAVFVVSVQRLLAHYPEAYLGRGREWFSLEEGLLHLSRTRPLQTPYLQLLLASRLKVAAA